MASGKTPLLVLGIAALGVGAFFWGRRLGRASGPTQPALPPADSFPPSPGAEAAWEAVTFDVDVFPAGVPHAAVDPPSSDLGISFGPACEVIAVARGWWPAAVSQVVEAIPAGTGLDAAVTLVLERYLPPWCQGAQTVALANLRSVLSERANSTGSVEMIFDPDFEWPEGPPGDVGRNPLALPATQYAPQMPGAPWSGVVPSLIEPSEPFPYGSVELAIIAEIPVATAKHAAWMEAVSEAAGQLGVEAGSPAAQEQARQNLKIPPTQGTATWITDQAYNQLYSVGQIPPKSQRGPGWQPYVDSWIRIFDYLKTLPWLGGSVEMIFDPDYWEDATPEAWPAIIATRLGGG